MASYLVSCCGSEGGLFILDSEKQRIVRRIAKGNIRGIGLLEGGSWIAHDKNLTRLNDAFDVVNRFRISGEGLYARLRRNLFLGKFVMGPDSPYAFIRRASKGLEKWLPRLPLRRMSLDLHDVCFHGGILFVVFSRYNCVAMFRRAGPPCVQGIETWIPMGYLYIDLFDGDRRHLNSICPSDEGLLMTMFSISGRNMEMKQRWAQVSDGGVILVRWAEIEEALDSGSGGVEKRQTVVYEVLFEGLLHPHSIQVRHGAAYVCESVARRIWKISLAHGTGEIIAELPGGYIRGLAMGDTETLVGASTTESHPAAKKPWDHAEAGIWLLKKNPDDFSESDHWRLISVPGAREIYDIKRLSESDCLHQGKWVSRQHREATEIVE